MSNIISPPKPKRKGNFKAGPGRPPGRKNNKALELEAATRNAVADINGAFEGDATRFPPGGLQKPGIARQSWICRAVAGEAEGCDATLLVQPVPWLFNPNPGVQTQALD